ncbi:hypothetical protein [Niveibacterium sp. SC-1]|uniref:hypothetical protein n=1 Tax=Niveibacterium sp. SC-1 TaxID=3135646 RepID=UPI0031200E11
MQYARLIAALCALGLAAPALAGKPTLLLTPVSIAPEASVPEKVQTECKIEETFAAQIGERLRKQGGGTTTSLDTPAGTQVMKVQITYVLGPGGGGWSGPKAVSLRAELLEGGKVRRSEKFSRTTTGGVFGAFKGTCGLIQRCVDTLAKDLQEWADADIDVPQEAPAPKAAAAE